MQFNYIMWLKEAVLGNPRKFGEGLWLDQLTRWWSNEVQMKQDNETQMNKTSPGIHSKQEESDKLQDLKCKHLFTFLWDFECRCCR